MQMLASAATAIICRVNLPISVALVWITNPLTMAPIFYFNYLVGTLLLSQPVTVTEFEASAAWFESIIGQIWLPLLVGSVVVGLATGTLSYIGMRGFWRWYVVQHLKKRQASRSLRTPSSS